MARIIDPKKFRKIAKSGKCKIFKVTTPSGKKTTKAFCPGAIGLVSKKQIKYFGVKGIKARPKAKGVKRRWAKFAKAAKTCAKKASGLPTGKRVRAYQQCLKKAKLL